MAAKSATLLFSYMYSSSAASYLLRLSCLGQCLRMGYCATLIIWITWPAITSYCYRCASAAVYKNDEANIIYNAAHSTLMQATYYVLLLLLSLWARSRHELQTRQLYVLREVLLRFNRLFTYLRTWNRSWRPWHNTLLSCLLHLLRSELSFTERPVSWLLCSILMRYVCMRMIVDSSNHYQYCLLPSIAANYTCERTGCPDSISLTSIRQLINIFDVYQYPGKWCEVVSPMCTPSSRLCETTTVYLHLTTRGNTSAAIYLSITSGLQRVRRDYLLIRHHLPWTYVPL